MEREQIKNSTINKIEKELLTIPIKKSKELSLSLLDGGIFLLACICVEKSTSIEDIDLVKGSIKDILSKYIKPIKDDYSWMVVFKKNGEVVDSIMSEMLL